MRPPFRDFQHIRCLHLEHTRPNVADVNHSLRLRLRYPKRLPNTEPSLIGVSPPAQVYALRAHHGADLQRSWHSRRYP